MYQKIAKSAHGRCYMSQGKPDEQATAFLSKRTEPEVIDGKRASTLLLIDDLMHLMIKDKQFAQLVQRIFTTMCHHGNITCFFITQAAFADKSFSILHKNTNYLILTKGHHDFASLTRQYLPGYNGWLTAAANECFYRHNYNYLVVDCNNFTQPLHRVKSGFLSNERQVIFKPKYY